jgi:hypothetical protein
VNARSHLLCRARGVTVRCIALALSAASVGCASSSNREDHRVENAAPDHHYRASDSQLNAASDRYTPVGISTDMSTVMISGRSHKTESSMRGPQTNPINMTQS